MSPNAIMKRIEKAADYFESCYLDWLNDFLTLAGYAQYYGITLEKATLRVSTGRKIHHQRHSS